MVRLGPSITCCDERSGGERGIDVNNTRAAWIEADRNLSLQVLDLDFPLTVCTGRTWPSAKLVRGSEIEEPGVGNRHVGLLQWTADGDGCVRRSDTLDRRAETLVPVWS